MKKVGGFPSTLIFKRRNYMLKEIFHYIYCMSIPSTVFVLIFVCCFWNYLLSKCNSKRQKNLWKISNILLFIFWLACVLYKTLLIRGNKAEINLTPFHFITAAIKTGNEEFFRTGWMNILLFVPGGMWLSYSTAKKTSTKRVLQVVFLIIISICIEAIQWHYQLGTVETDDVICNTLGAIIGVTSDLWAFKVIELVKPIVIKAYNLIKQKIKKT